MGVVLMATSESAWGDGGHNGGDDGGVNLSDSRFSNTWGCRCLRN